jgi:hypothetical protein
LVDRSYDTILWYANNFWTWFLEKKKEKRGRYKVFICHDLADYPEDFFLAAHVNRQGKYFYHFGRALDASRERAEARKRAKEQAGQLQTDLPDPSEPPKEAEQEFPEELHIADNEAEDIEGDESSDITTQTGDAFPTEDTTAKNITSDAALSNPPATPITERIIDMLDFSRRNREAIDQLRLAVESLTRTITQEREQLKGEIISELQTRLQTELKTVQQNLLERIQQIPPSQAELSQLSHDFVIQVQAIQQALAREQEQFRQEVAHTRETLTEEVRQLQTTQDLSPIHAHLTNLINQIDHIEQTLTEAIKQLPAPPDLASIRSELESNSEHLQYTLLAGIQQSPSISELPQIAANIVAIQRQVDQLTQQTSISLDGQTWSIEESIQKASVQAKDAIDILKDVYIKWLEGLQQHLQTAQQGHDAVDKYLQTVRTYISPNGSGEQNSSEETATSE